MVELTRGFFVLLETEQQNCVSEKRCWGSERTERTPMKHHQMKKEKLAISEESGCHN